MMQPGWNDLLRVFGRIGLLSFGGPAAQIALMHRELVEERTWLSEKQFLSALSFCMLLPGPEAMQLATYAGWRLRGTAGGLLAGGLFVLPGAIVIAGLAWAYIAWGGAPLAQALFVGVKATVVVIVLQALLRLSNKALRGPADWALAGIAFVAIFLLGVPFPLIIVCAAIWGAVTCQDTKTAPLPLMPPVQTMRTVLIWAALWATPLVILWLADAGFLMELALFFGKLAVVTFGGAYAVLAYMTQAVVTEHGWLSTPQMVDALGLAETTPGPLILVTEFTGILAGFAQGGTEMAILAGLLTLWMTFTPCFLWIFAGAPYLERIAARPRLSAGMAAITAAVVGVILNLSVWFAIHVYFARVSGGVGPLPIPLPDLASFQPLALGLSLFAWVMMTRLKRGILLTLAATSMTGAMVITFT